MRDLQADLETCNKATPGPWEHGRWFYGPSGHGECSISQTGEMYDHAKVYGTNNHKYEAEGKANAEFIAAAREGWPEAIERAIKAEAELTLLHKVATAAAGVVKQRGFTEALPEDWLLLAAHNEYEAWKEDER